MYGVFMGTHYFGAWKDNMTHTGLGWLCPQQTPQELMQVSVS